MTIEIVDFPMKNGGSFHSYVTVYQAGYASLSPCFWTAQEQTEISRSPVRSDMRFAPKPTEPTSEKRICSQMRLKPSLAVLRSP